MRFSKIPFSFVLPPFIRFGALTFSLLVLFSSHVALAVAPAPKSNAGFTIQPGDRLEITVFREDDLTGVYEIDPIGMLNFPLIGEIQTTNLRIDELLDRLRWNLRKYLVNPQVRIARAEGSIKTISILGHVEGAGAFEYSPGLTLMRVISEAGGFKRSANRRKIRIVRMVDGEKASIVVNGVNVINGVDDDPAVKPGDMIFVPESIF